MKVTVDPLVCEANAICVGILPEVFDLDDEDNLTILKPDIPAELEAKARQAVRSCPKAALSITE